MNPSEIAAALGKLGGQKTSSAKAKAVKENGKKGGRPKGVKETKPRAPRKPKI